MRKAKSSHESKISDNVSKHTYTPSLFPSHAVGPSAGGGSVLGRVTQVFFRIGLQSLVSPSLSFAADSRRLF